MLAIMQQLLHDDNGRARAHATSRFGAERRQAAADRAAARPIIALAAHAMREARERYFTTGCDAFAPKPIDRDQLLDLLAQHLAKPLPSDS
jgi:CheY-like chemotaxis protein